MADDDALEISITHKSSSRYRIGTHDPVFQSQQIDEEMDLDPEAPELRTDLAAIRAGSISMEKLQDCGSFLFRKLFSGRIRSAYDNRRAAAQSGRAGRQKAVRILLNLGSDAFGLYEVPWAALYDKDQDLWLGEFSTRIRTPLSFLVPGQPPLPPAAEIPLRILVVGASPIDLPPLEVHEEAANIEEALFDLRQRGLINIEMILSSENGRPVTRSRLHQKISDWVPHILHVIGHGPQNETASAAGVYLETEERERDFYPADSLQSAMGVRGESVRLAVLNACNTALAARRLANKGIAAVGMAAPILGRAAVSFSRGLYESLISQGLPMDDAVNWARSEIRQNQQENECGWIFPVLFLPQGKATSIAPAVRPPVPVKRPEPQAPARPVTRPTTPNPTPPVGAPAPLPVVEETGLIERPRVKLPWRWLLALPLLPLLVLFGQHLMTRSTRVPPEMVRIPEGTFKKGGESTPMIDLLRRYGERVQLRELLARGPERGRIDQPYFIDRYEVTNESYARFLRGKNHTPAYWDQPRFSDPEQPVVGVDAHDAEAYCRWAGKRLPTSDEWERAARGTDGRLYPWGNEFHKENTNTGESLDSHPVKGGAYARDRSPDGVYDMGGNVSEWTSTPREIDGIAGRDLAGGSWGKPGDLYAMPFVRNAATLSVRGEGLGFRCARTAAPDEDPPADMVSIPLGEFLKGGEDSFPLNLARRMNLTDSSIVRLLSAPPGPAWLDEFLLDRHEVTHREYNRFLEALASGQLPEGSPPGKDHTPTAWSDPQFNQPEQPVVGVDWQDAEAYCRWADKRLPTSDEWERVVRGTGGRHYPWGEEFDPDRCNTEESPDPSQTSTVASHPECSSPEGIFDLVGNADEWTADREKDEGEGRDLRILRGGGWIEPGELRGLGYFHSVASTEYRGQDVGFRCAETPRPSWLERLVSWIIRQ